MIVFSDGALLQTYGDLVNFHPHLHALVTDGLFTPTGWFVAFPQIDLKSGTLHYLSYYGSLPLSCRATRASMRRRPSTT